MNPTHRTALLKLLKRCAQLMKALKDAHSIGATDDTANGRYFAPASALLMGGVMHIMRARIGELIDTGETPENSKAFADLMQSLGIKEGDFPS